MNSFIESDYANHPLQTAYGLSPVTSNRPILDPLVAQVHKAGRLDHYTVSVDAYEWRIS
jgi:hypothetical protein